MNICNSGGAMGADSYFGHNASCKGHDVIHWAFQGMQINPKARLHKRVLSPIDLLKGDDLLRETNTWLKRKYPTSSVYVNNLLRRNYWQIEDTDSIYAVSYIDENGLVGGGTGWAVTMGLLRDVENVYVFDQAKDAWFGFVSMSPREKVMQWCELAGIPTAPSGKYTGIGSVEIQPNGINAIEGLYRE